MFGIPAITRGYPSEKSRIFAVFPEFGIFGRREFKTVFGKKSFLAIRAGAAVDIGQKMKIGREDRIDRYFGEMMADKCAIGFLKFGMIRTKTFAGERFVKDRFPVPSRDLSPICQSFFLERKFAPVVRIEWNLFLSPVMNRAPIFFGANGMQKCRRVIFDNF